MTGIWAHFLKRRSVSHSCGNAGIDMVQRVREESEFEILKDGEKECC